VPVWCLRGLSTTAELLVLLRMRDPDVRRIVMARKGLRVVVEASNVSWYG
jgi:hypothetical protein